MYDKFYTAKISKFCTVFGCIKLIQQCKVQLRHLHFYESNSEPYTAECMLHVIIGCFNQHPSNSHGLVKVATRHNYMCCGSKNRRQPKGVAHKRELLTIFEMKEVSPWGVWSHAGTRRRWSRSMWGIVLP